MCMFPLCASAFPFQIQGSRLTILYFLCEPKVDQLKVTFGINEDVLWFQVAVCNALALVQEF
jgi:hypothetical protein